MTSGLGFRFDLSDFQQLQRQFNNLASTNDLDELLELLATEGETQTRHRIKVEKKAPDGSNWPDWSDKYAATRHGGHSLLENEGHLVDSLQSFVEGQSAGWGSNLVYAAAQQFGNDETVQVPAHQRLITQVFGRPLRFPVYANVGAYSFQQNIPARAYLGLSAANEADLLAVANDWLKQKMHSSFKP